MTRKQIDASLADLEMRLSHSGGRSKLALWMEQNHQGFSAMLARYGRRGRRWEVLAEWFAERKLLSVPKAFWSDQAEDADARAEARRRAAKTTKTTWERVQKRGATAKGAEPPPRFAPPAPAPVADTRPEQNSATRIPVSPRPSRNSEPAPKPRSDDDEFGPSSGLLGPRSEDDE